MFEIITFWFTGSLLFHCSCAIFRKFLVMDTTVVNWTFCLSMYLLFSRSFSLWRGVLSSSPSSSSLTHSLSLSLSLPLSVSSRSSLSLSSSFAFAFTISSAAAAAEKGSAVGGSGGGDPVMDPHGGRAGTAAVNEGSSSSIPPEIDEEAMWQMSFREGGTGPYPERPGEPDCAYYIRTGLCRFGMTCKFNHPANRKLAVAEARIKGGYPERVGQPECQYYMKTGTCKFGATCKFHHPRDKAGIAGQVQLNVLGYPLRLGEKECAYYVRTGLCKFGNTCKFHHPHPSNAMISLRGSPIYPPVHSPTNPGQQSYAGGLANWSLSRASFIPSPRWQGPSSYAQLIVPQGLVQVPNWNPYSGQLSSVSSPENQQQAPAQFYSTSHQSETATGSQGTFSSYRSGSIPMGLYPMQRENAFPERPDQPECQFYMKTGDCKFGAVCKFHHPRERLVPIPNCVLSPLGLPLRPGEPSCHFYSRYGICKFGPNCKFDHPVETITYNPTTSPAADIPSMRRLMGSSSGPPALTLSTEGPAEAGQGNSRRRSLSEPRQMTSVDENIETEGSHTTSSIGQVTSFT